MNDAFSFDSEDYLVCGKLRIKDFVKQVVDSNVVTTPFFVYSKKKIVENFLSYKNSFNKILTEKHGIKTHISYSLKANFNPHLLNLFHQHDSWVSLVNGNELLLALKVGYSGENLIFNGNGKTHDEIETAIKAGCYLNIDSDFNLKHTIEICKKFERENKHSFLPAKLLVRLNPSIDAAVHPYLTTSIKTSKFGVNLSQLEDVIQTIKLNSQYITLVGYHCHLGSTITSLDGYRECVKCLVEMVNMTREKYGVTTIKLINFGGGLGINYYKYANRTSLDAKPDAQIPTPADLASVLADNLRNITDIEVVVEPGRSLIANTSILVTKLIGVKCNENKNFLVVDASMCECIRPCLYGAYHHIDYVEPVKNNVATEKCHYDIVGPVCESGDFIGKDRYLEKIKDENGVYLAIFDVGAYCAAMASNYNMHLKPAELLIDDYDNKNDAKPDYRVIRKADTFDQLVQAYDFEFKNS